MSYQQGMQSPWGNPQGGSSNYGGQNYNQGGGFGGDPFVGAAMGMMHNKQAQQMAASYVEQELRKRIGQTRSFSEFFFTPTLKGYFDVDNKYVLKKLLKIVFPFTKAGTDTSYDNSYDTTYGYGANSEEQQKKRLMAPDLYIPLMSFMTFILMVCLARGIGDAFKPDLISYYTFNCVLFGFLEMLLYKFIFIVVSVKTLSLLDIMAFLNYKFVGLCLILISSFVVGNTWISLAIKGYFSISFVYYMYAELRSHAQGVAEVDIGRASLKSDTIVYFLSGLQFLTMWLLVFTMI